jgi:WhiB family transcriptional regulator, redox-sensing transcriptional regulator
MTTTGPGDWMAQGACAGDPWAGEIWFPEPGTSNKFAKKMCSMCPVQKQCLEWALETEQPYGVWGGKSEAERRQMLGKRGRNAARDSRKLQSGQDPGGLPSSIPA